MKYSGRFVPACSDFVSDGCVLAYLHRTLIDSARSFAARQDRSTPPLDLSALLLELCLLLVSGNRTTERILLRLAEQEKAEPDVWLRDDIRIAWITVLYAARGYSEPQVAATYQVLGLHPSKVFQAMLDRDQALLGPKQAIPPKKSPHSVSKSAKAGVA